jgi:hypothetical protein
MIPEDKYPVGKPVPRIDSFEEVESASPELTDEEKSWAVVSLQARNDSFETLPPEGTEVVIRVRCDSSATAAEVSAFVEKLRSAVAASADNRFPVQIVIPTGG